MQALLALGLLEHRIDLDIAPSVVLVSSRLMRSSFTEILPVVKSGLSINHHLHNLLLTSSVMLLPITCPDIHSNVGLSPANAQARTILNKGYKKKAFS